MKKPTTSQLSRPADADKMLWREVDGWVHHVAALERKARVHTTELDRPIELASRYAAIKDIAVAIRASSLGIFALPERRLTPRAPYQAAPLSYLNAWGRSWSLWCEANRLEWAEFGAADARSGILEFWFRNVVPGTTALVSLYLTVGVTGPGVKGTFEVRSSAAWPRQFQATGFNDHIADIVVRPSDAYAVLVRLEPGQGVGYLAFRRAEYRPL
ncbi:MAG: hypothetical protein HS113_25765 [Verrucomicrobiales bacterium]|nr:hypothetical protein [Verrucomicrobiales bacterium]